MQRPPARIKVLAKPAIGKRNPYTGLLTASLRDYENIDITEFRIRQAWRGRYDILHLHWPYGAWEGNSLGRATIDSLIFILTVSFLRLRGTKVVWTAHDTSEHHIVHPRLSRLMWSWYTRQLGGLLVLSESSKALLFKKWPHLERLPVAVTPHGHYKDAYPNTISRNDARLILGMKKDNFVLGMVGTLLEYKNVPQLILAFREITDPNARLILAGRIVQPLTLQGITDLINGDDRILLQPEYIANDEMQIYINAIDLMVYPYRNILNSGSLLLSLSFDRPVLVPNLGSMGEQQQHFGPEWVRTYEGKLTAELLRNSAIEAKEQTPEKLDPHLLTGWDEVASQTANLYRASMGITTGNPLT